MNKMKYVVVLLLLLVAFGGKYEQAKATQELPEQNLVGSFQILVEDNLIEVPLEETALGGEISCSWEVDVTSPSFFVQLTVLGSGNWPWEYQGAEYQVGEFSLEFETATEKFSVFFGLLPEQLILNCNWHLYTEPDNSESPVKVINSRDLHFNEGDHTWHRIWMQNISEDLILMPGHMADNLTNFEIRGSDATEPEYCNGSYLTIDPYDTCYFDVRYSPQTNTYIKQYFGFEGDSTRPNDPRIYPGYRHVVVLTAGVKRIFMPFVLVN